MYPQSFRLMIIFLGSVAFIVYVLFFYPFALVIWSRISPKNVIRKYAPRTVSIVLPVHNGERWIANKLKDIRNLEYPPELLETIVISNASTDRTLQIARENAGSHVRVIEVAKPGKAAALNAGLASARGEIVFFTDVRQALPPECLHALIADFADPRVGVVSGELVISEGDRREEASVGLYWKYEKLIRSSQSRIGSVPGATGSIYAMRRNLTRPLPEGTLLDDVYLPMCAYFRGYRITWEPEAKAYDEPASLKTEFRRKVRTLAGNYQLIPMFPRLLIPNHPLWFHFVSHKLGRLFLPYALLLVFLSSFMLPAPLKYVAFGGQALFYGIAALDPFLSDASALKRFSSPLGTFVVMMAAALYAASILFVPPEKLWKPTR